MAWYEGTMSQAIGALLTVLSEKLPLNSKWSIYDNAAGTNVKVYRNYDAAANVDYYVRVADNQTTYAIIQVWQGWNAVTHVGTGQSLTTIGGYTMRIWKWAGGYGLSVKDHRFVYVDTAMYKGTYVGQLSRYDTTKNMPVYIGHLEDAYANNPLGGPDDNYSIGWRCLFDEGGTVRVLWPYGMGSSYMKPKTIAGNYIVFECPVFGDGSYLLMGALNGVAYYYQFGWGYPLNGDIVTLNGIDWMFIGSANNYWSLVRKD
jgi:hypothetical protein